MSRPRSSRDERWRRHEPQTEVRSSRSNFEIHDSRQSQVTGLPTSDSTVRRERRATTHWRSVVRALPSRLRRRSRGEWRSTPSGRSVRQLSAKCRRTSERRPVNVRGQTWSSWFEDRSRVVRLRRSPNAWSGIKLFNNTPE